MIQADSSDIDIAHFLARVKKSAGRHARLAAELATVLAGSGDRYIPASLATADVASTGGPASLSTLLCPLFLRAGGLAIPKLAVPGRPAGGIDCLAQVAGYRTHLDKAAIDTTLDTCGYAHFLSADRYAPLDARVFLLRQKHGFQDVPTLVAASLLSKKLAVGVRHAGLDIRVARHGNFGGTWAEAAENAELFAEAATLLGIQASPVLTDGSVPYQGYIGRSEALLALARVFDSDSDSWLDSHVDLCRDLAVAAAPENVRDKLLSADRASLRSAFLANIEAQGGSEGSFENVVASCYAAHTKYILAETDGKAEYSLDLLRRTLVHYQSTIAAGVGEFADPVGIILLRWPASEVKRGTPLASVRIDARLDSAEVLRAITSAVRQADATSGTSRTTEKT